MCRQNWYVTYHKTGYSSTAMSVGQEARRLRITHVSSWQTRSVKLTSSGGEKAMWLSSNSSGPLYQCSCKISMSIRSQIRQVEDSENYGWVESCWSLDPNRFRLWAHSTETFIVVCDFLTQCLLHDLATHFRIRIGLDRKLLRCFVAISPCNAEVSACKLFKLCWRTNISQ